jgi:hypothetical protein
MGDLPKPCRKLAEIRSLPGRLIALPLLFTVGHAKLDPQPIAVKRIRSRSHIWEFILRDAELNECAIWP